MTTTSDGYVIWVEFDIDPADREAFLALVADNAERSVADEPGCRRFDVLVPDDQTGAVALYEIYANEAAFGAHLETAHYHRFEAQSAALVRAKRVRVFALEEHAK